MGEKTKRDLDWGCGCWVERKIKTERTRSRGAKDVGEVQKKKNLGKRKFLGRNKGLRRRI
jgi:hypothetical protein